MLSRSITAATAKIKAHMYTSHADNIRLWRGQVERGFTTPTKDLKQTPSFVANVASSMLCCMFKVLFAVITTAFYVRRRGMHDCREKIAASMNYHYLQKVVLLPNNG
jgi:hypothetical protein